MRLRLHIIALMPRLGPRGLLAILALLGACGEPPAPRSDTPSTSASTFVDAAGVRHDMQAPARRIVSLVPSATATLHAIGADDLVVGRTDFDTAAWIADLPSVGGGLDPNLEALVALRPDVVIRFEGEQDPRTPARLDDLGIVHVAVRPSSLSDIYATNRILGVMTGLTDAADALSSSIRSELAAVADAARGQARVRVVYTLGGTPPWVAGPETFVDGVLSLAGGDNVFSDLDAPWAAVSPEVLRTRDIDVVLVPAASSFDAGLTPGARVVEVGGLLDLPGPDVAVAARRVAELLHPESRH